MATSPQGTCPLGPSIYKLQNKLHRSDFFYTLHPPPKKIINPNPNNKHKHDLQLAISNNCCGKAMFVLNQCYMLASAIKLALLYNPNLQAFKISIKALSWMNWTFLPGRFLCWRRSVKMKTLVAMTTDGTPKRPKVSLYARTSSTCTSDKRVFRRMHWVI